VGSTNRALVTGANSTTVTGLPTAPATSRARLVLPTPPGPADLLGALVAGAGLTPREVEVTRLLCRGLTDAEIARELTVSAHTAHDHVRAVRTKLGVRNRAEVASRVFADHYFERFLATASVVHDG
jgi:DNA-binding NarL/FixJ family response regulator